MCDSSDVPTKQCVTLKFKEFIRLHRGGKIKSQTDFQLKKISRINAINYTIYNLNYYLNIS